MGAVEAKWWIPVVTGAAVAAGLAAFLWAGGPGPRWGRPAASGEVGRVVVYGQTPSGPVELRPSGLLRLPRPQELVFWFQVQGTGPRDVRIEVVMGARRQPLYEARIRAPVEGDYLDVSLPLDERVPDRLQVDVVIEPPHAMNLTTSYEIVLEGGRGELDRRRGERTP